MSETLTAEKTGWLFRKWFQETGFLLVEEWTGSFSFTQHKNQLQVYQTPLCKHSSPEISEENVSTSRDGHRWRLSQQDSGLWKLTTGKRGLHNFKKSLLQQSMQMKCSSQGPGISFKDVPFDTCGTHRLVFYPWVVYYKKDRTKNLVLFPSLKLSLQKCILNSKLSKPARLTFWLVWWSCIFFLLFACVQGLPRPSVILS